MGIGDKIKTLNFGSSVIGLLEEALKAWKTYIETRQQAYERKMDKRQKKAIQIGEEGFEMMNEVFNYVYSTGKMLEDKEFSKLKEKLYKLKKKFNEYD